MKRNRNQAVRNSSRHGAAMQSKIQKGRGKVRPSPVSPSIALFLEGDGLSEEIVDLSEAEYAALKRAAVPSGAGILMFMANAALEKAGWPGSSNPSKGGLTAACQFPGGNVTNIEFDLEKRRRIEAALKRSGMTFDHFMQRAVEHFVGCSEFASTLPTDQIIRVLCNQTRSRTGRSPQLDLEDSINQAIAFLDLLADRYTRQAGEEDKKTGGARGAGLDGMVHQTISDLHGDFRTVISEGRKAAARPSAQQEAA
jgi:hypothetical protein